MSTVTLGSNSQADRRQKEGRAPCFPLRLMPGKETPLLQQQRAQETKQSPACSRHKALGFEQRKVPPQSKSNAPKEGERKYQSGWRTVRDARKPSKKDQLSPGGDKESETKESDGSQRPRLKKNSRITSNPCSRPTFIMSLQRLGTMHMTSTALCGVGWGESRVSVQFQRARLER